MCMFDVYVKKCHTHKNKPKQTKKKTKPNLFSYSFCISPLSGEQFVVTLPRPTLRLSSLGHNYNLFLTFIAKPYLFLIVVLVLSTQHSSLSSQPPLLLAVRDLNLSSPIRTVLHLHTLVMLQTRRTNRKEKTPVTGV